MCQLQNITGHLLHNLPWAIYVLVSITFRFHIGFIVWYPWHGLSHDSCINVWIRHLEQRKGSQWEKR